MDEKKSTSANDGALGLSFETASQIGERLRWAREQKQLTQEHVAAKTKIRERYIAAIETGEWGALPPGLNGRGLVRLYAKEMGISVSEFESRQTQPTETYLADEDAPIVTTVSRTNLLKKKNEPKKIIEKASQTTSASPIVTPNISEVLGIPLSITQGPRSAASIIPVVGVEDYMARLEMPKAQPVQKDIGIKFKEKNNKIASAIITHHTHTTHTQHASAHSNNEEQPHTFQQNGKSKEANTKELSKQIFFLKRGLAAVCLVGILIGGTLLIYRQYQRSQMGLNSQPIEIVAKKKPIVEKPRLAAALPIAPPVAQPIPVTPPPISLKTVEPMPTAAPEEVPLVDRLAHVEILEPVRLVVESDDKTIFSGYHDEGSLEIFFKRQAKIQVSDGSKVKLVYGRWAHGELGTPARKRKIVLNAKPYQE